MNCPRCGKRTSVTDSRTGEDIVIRVRKCSCGTVFKTVENIDNSEETDEEYRDLKKKSYWEFCERKGMQNAKKIL